MRDRTWIPKTRNPSVLSQASCCKRVNGKCSTRNLLGIIEIDVSLVFRCGTPHATSSEMGRNLSAPSSEGHTLEGSTAFTTRTTGCGGSQRHGAVSLVLGDSPSELGKSVVFVGGSNFARLKSCCGTDVSFHLDPASKSACFCISKSLHAGICDVSIPRGIFASCARRSSS